MMIPELADVALFAWYIGVLVLLEGLLSADNALVLAVMVRHLPKNQQRRVLFWGIWGAVGFRVLALLLASVLLHFWICKVVGGGYLLYLALSHFYRRRYSSSHSGDDQTAAPGGWLRSFWGTVTSITVADIAFSIDSILAAVGMAEGFPDHFGEWAKFSIVLIGGVLGIITMRFVVRYFLILLERFPGLEEGAYYLVAWIGLKLVLSGYHQFISKVPELKHLAFHIPEPLFWVVMLLIAAVSLAKKPGARLAAETSELAETRDLLDTNEEAHHEEQSKLAKAQADAPAGAETPGSPKQKS
jgi:YkoY family integral membrane protein